MAAPVTPVASPLRPAYHFWAQASTAGARKALPTPAGRLYTARKSAALPAGTTAASRKAPPSSPVPAAAASRGPRASCSRPPAAQPTPYPATSSAKASVAWARVKAYSSMTGR